MTRCSSRQLALWRKMPEIAPTELARKYNQTSFGSLARRGWVEYKNGMFIKTQQGHEDMDRFGHENVFRHIISDRISIHFRGLADMAAKEKGKKTA